MPDEPQAQLDSTPKASDETVNTDTGNDQPQTIPYSRFKQKVDEANALKQRQDELQAQLDKFTKSQADKERAEQLARGEHENVINQLQQELEAARQIAATNASYRAALMASVKTRIEQIPDTMRTLVPDDLVADPVALNSWLDKNAALLQRPVPPDTNAGTVGDKRPAAKLTPEQRQTAKLFGLSDEQYAAGLGEGANSIPLEYLQGKKPNG